MKGVFISFSFEAAQNLLIDISKGDVLFTQEVDLTMCSVK